VQAELPHASSSSASPISPPSSVNDLEFERSLMEALVIVLAVSLISLAGASASWSGSRFARARRRRAGDAGDGWNSSASRSVSDHRARPAVDDGIIAVEMMVVEDGRRLGSPEGAAISYVATAMPR